LGYIDAAVPRGTFVAYEFVAVEKEAARAINTTNTAQKLSTVGQLYASVNDLHPNCANFQELNYGSAQRKPTSKPLEGKHTETLQTAGLSGKQL
jgi:hypothetical protein